MQISNFPDFKINGKWVESHVKDGVRYVTRAKVVWKGVIERTIYAGTFQTNHPSYLGVTNGFECFDDFADWCQYQVGYLNKASNGRFWNLDKDVIKPNNKVYNRDSCAFIPTEINNLLIFRQAQAPHRTKDSLPIGVSFHKSTRKYQAEISSSSKSTYLGLFEDPLEGHRAWQKAKVIQIENCIHTYLGLVSDKVIEGLHLHRNAIYQDILHGAETVRFQ